MLFRRTSSLNLLSAWRRAREEDVAELREYSVAAEEIRGRRIAGLRGFDGPEDG